MRNDNWTEITLGDLVEIKHGYAFKGEYFRDQPTNDVCLTPGNFALGGGFKDDKLKFYDGPVDDEYVLHFGDLLVTMTDLSKQADTLGYPALIPNETGGRRYLHNQRLGRVFINDENELSKEFLFYLLCTDEYRHEILASVTGTTVKHTSPTKIGAFKTTIPPIEEQRAIASILGALDDKIELNRRMNATLESIARAIFKSWFVDFDPVKINAGQMPASSAIPTKHDQKFLDLFPSTFQESPLGKTPQEWQRFRLDEVTEFIVDSEHKTAPTQDEGIPSIRTTNVRNGRLDLIGANKVSEETYQEWIRRAEPRGFDLILTREAPVGDVAAVPPNTRLCLGQRTVLIRPDVKDAHPLFLLYLIQRPEIRFDLECRAEGSVVPHLNMSDIREFKIALPPIVLQNAFADQIEEMHLAVERNERQSLALSAARDALLPKLLSGKLVVPDDCTVVPHNDSDQTSQILINN